MTASFWSRIFTLGVTMRDQKRSGAVGCGQRV